MCYRSDVSVTGRLGRFALGMMKKKAQSLGDEFAQNLQARLQQLGEEARAGSPVACSSVAGPAIAAPADGAAVPHPAVVGDEIANPAAVSAAVANPAAAAPRRSWWQALLAFFRGERKTGVVKSGH